MAATPIAYLVMTNVSPHAWQAPILTSRQVIGRHASAQIRIPDEYTQTSRRHAEVWSASRAIWIKDLGSLCGTAVNGVSLEKDRKVQISAGDRIRIGMVELEIVSDLSEVENVLDATPDLSLDGTAVARGRSESTEAALRTLTPAELEIVMWMNRGYTQLEDLGKKLFRSPHTIRTHLNNIFRKLNVHSRDELLSWLRRRQNGLGKETQG